MRMAIVDSALLFVSERTPIERTPIAGSARPAPRCTGYAGQY